MTTGNLPIYLSWCGDIALEVWITQWLLQVNRARKAQVMTTLALGTTLTTTKPDFVQMSKYLSSTSLLTLALFLCSQ